MQYFLRVTEPGYECTAPMKLPVNPSVSFTDAWLAYSQYSLLRFCHKKDLDDKINSVMPNYRRLQAGSKALIGCSFPVLAL